MAGHYGSETAPSNFQLPSLGRHLTRMAHELHNETGYCYIRGLPLAGFSYEDSIVVFLGIASYLSDQRAMQDGFGNMISMYFRRTSGRFLSASNI